MSGKERPSISEWIKANSSVSKVAAELNVTRPTAYKYIERYDAGEYDKLPESVIAYFEQRLANDGGRQIDEAKQSLMKEISVIQAKLNMESEHIHALMARRDDIEHSIAKIRADLRESVDGRNLEKELNDLQMMRDVLTKESFECSENMKTMEKVLADKQRMLSEYEHMEYVPADTKDVFRIKSSCYIENGKCMIVHTGDDSDPYDENLEYNPEDRIYYRLHLYSKIGNEFAHLGEYEPVKNRNFFIIDDVFLSAPLYYNIVTCIVHPQFESWDSLKEGEDPPLVETSGANCTGICELKPAK